ncbi:MAG: carboxypeptidase-like regulatory domain-containing protein [Flavisolibacter sp.]
MKLSTFGIFFIILMSSYFSAFSQDRLLNGDFKEVPFKQFIKELEQKTPIYFYYDSSLFNNTFISVSYNNATLQQVLDRAFSNTDIHFAFDDNGHVFLTRKYRILTKLPAGFPGNSILSGDETAILPGLIDSAVVVKSVSENKLYEIGSRTSPVKNGLATLSGSVRNFRTGEPVINALIYEPKLNRTVTTDAYGYYSVVLPPGPHVLNVQASGLTTTEYQLMVYSDGKFDIELNEKVERLKEVVIVAKNATQVNRVQMGVERLTLSTIKKVPTVFGEADVLRVVLTLPGVKTVGEASTGFNVRGGAADQNLILLNDATIYNPSHFFGMFSALNPEIVKDIELYKSSIPAHYGGRLSSVLDISTREGNKKNFAGSAGIGLITSRINIEGPLVKNKTSFIAGARTTYANWLIGLLPDAYEKSRASFNDFNLNINHQVNKKNDLYFTGYASNDRFSIANDTVYNYSNRNISVKWKHNFNSKVNLFVTSGYDKYQYKVNNDKDNPNAYKMGFDIAQGNLKSDLVYYVNLKHTIETGISTIYYKLHPGYYEPYHSTSQVRTDNIPAEQALESAIYLSDRYSINNNLSLQAGIRFSLYNYLGPQEVRLYADGLPRDESNQVGTKMYENGNSIKRYMAPEYRISIRYSLRTDLSLKAAFNTTRQYVHMMSNTTAIAPTDIWKLSDVNIRPQKANQYSAGVYKNFKSNTIETSAEVYYKKINDYLDYKPGAILVLNHHIETDVLPTKGKAYGIELMVKKAEGKLNGWISYTYSRILLKMDDSTAGEPVNGGNYYPANYDKPHEVLLIGNFKINHRFSMSLNVNYSTGRPITLPVGRYYYAGSQRVLYSERNAYRIPDYFRTDFAMNIDGNYKVKQRTHNSWTIGVYNLTGRKNPYSVYFVSENGLINGYKLSIFGSIIPFINFNIRFQ